MREGEPNPCVAVAAGRAAAAMAAAALSSRGFGTSEEHERQFSQIGIISLGIRARCRRVWYPQAALVTVVLAFICWLPSTHLLVGQRIQPDRAGWRSVSPASPHLKELLCL